MALLFKKTKKFHMTYNEKRLNNSLERFIWYNYILSQNCSISKTLMSKLWMLLIEIPTKKASIQVLSLL